MSSCKVLPECSKATSLTTVFARNGTLRLHEVDLHNEPILVPPCGHPLTVSTLDSLIHLDEYYQKQLNESSGFESNNSVKDLNAGPRQQVYCSICSEPIGASFLRYGRPIKHTQLLSMMQGFRMSHFKKQWIEDRNRGMDIIESLVSAKDRLVSALGNTKVIRCPDPPQSTGRRVRVQDGVSIGDLGCIASLYQIPWKHQTEWAAAITPAKDMLALLGYSRVVELTNQGGNITKCTDSRLGEHAWAKRTVRKPADARRMQAGLINHDECLQPRQCRDEGSGRRVLLALVRRRPP
ncbi:MAG: hypothetical protein J3R72DRAFT_526494 [Linnemannia gamsii]|nr:MAG: hypothetical protein J3R72DRAFT_526494 [Linnemannia gamsii]